jgi:hypothetical protein
VTATRSSVASRRDRAAFTGGVFTGAALAFTLSRSWVQEPQTTVSVMVEPCGARVPAATD